MRTLTLYTIGFITALTLSFAGCKSADAPVELPLNDGWKLTLRDGRMIDVAVPGLVHTDLHAARLIPDPFYGFNEDSLQWIGTKEWTYTLDFEVDNSILAYTNVQLVFEGLDTYARVSLNGREVLNADNMFRLWEIDVKKHLRPGANRLEVRFFPPDSISLAKASAYNIQLPEHRAFTRKAPFQAGWDWGPVFHTMGIWKPVYLAAWNHARMKYPAILTQDADSLKAGLVAAATIVSGNDGHGYLRLRMNDKEILNQKVTLSKGTNQLSIPFQIAHPELWWPNGIGKANLSRFDFEFTDQAGNKISQTVISGIRKAVLIREADSIGESFLFRINGKDIFVKGANYIPEDHFVTRMSRERTRKLLSDASAVGMNMIRVWGGGIYPNNEFFAMCDSLGLMVWQDFMFACTMYPWDTAFVGNVRHEAAHQVQRLRGHPSLVLWCGNNEVSEGFHNWGWQKSLSWTAGDSIEIWQGYLAVFETLLPEIVNQHDPFTPYWPSSPSLGWGRSESYKRGDVHYWGVWWGEEPFEAYRQKVGRFHSEYGFQAMPPIESVRQFLPENERFVGSAGFEAHQKHPRGTRLINDYMKRYFPVPKNLEDYIYTSQLTQSYGIGMAIETHRIHKPRNMGTLFWQLNDSWPVTSWSSIDYYGRWKALHYHLQTFYHPTQVFFSRDRDTLSLFVVHDGLYKPGLQLHVDILNTKGQKLFSDIVSFTADSASSQNVCRLSLSKVKSLGELSELVVQGSLFNNNTLISKNNHFLVPPKMLRLHPRPVELHVRDSADVVVVGLQSDVFHYAVQLQSNDEDGRFSDNFFHLMPGTKKTVIFHPSGKVHNGILSFSYRSLNRIISNN
ncbi:MAG: glycoside hydrolase family 2 protein [Bacteroidetes bacterium]|nr:glycoside hydrolase family 2 protein [Bacteroidota bacterium]